MASSVAPGGAPSWARRSAAARNAWGVWTATSRARSSVLVTCPESSTALMVSLGGTPGTAPSAPPSATAPMTAAKRAGDARGRAASWTTITSASAGTAASPQRTESARVAPPGHDDVGAVRLAALRAGGEDEDHAGRRGPAGDHGPLEDRAAAEGGELLQPAEAVPGAPGHDDRPHLCHGATGPGDQVRASFRRSSAVSSSTLRAKVSSETRIWRARCSMRFSPAERPLSLSRIERFRTTSATW